MLEVLTSGAVSPNDALTQSSHILDKYFRMFFDLGNTGYEDGQLEGEELPENILNIPDKRIEELDFSQRTFNCLRRASLLTLRALAMASESDLSGIRGFGKKSLLEVRDKLAEHGLELKPPKGGYRPLDVLGDDEEEEDFD